MRSILPASYVAPIEKRRGVVEMYVALNAHDHCLFAMCRSVTGAVDYFCDVLQRVGRASCVFVFFGFSLLRRPTG